jgi:hypothetical protein
MQDQTEHTMVNRIDGYWISIIAPGFFIVRDVLPFAPGTNVYASISLSEVNTEFAANDPNPKFSTTAFVESWTFYNPDGSESEPQLGGFTQNAVEVENCATIKFTLVGDRVAAIAQINIFTL